MIEEFLNIPANREKWIQHVSTAKHPLGQIKELRLSFKHPLVDAHFRFAKDILDILGDLNELFQVRYAFVNNLWECLVSLHQYLVRELRKIENRDLSGFPYLARIGEENLPQFVVILKHLILNLNVRFFNISFSMDKRVVKPFLD